MNTIKQTGNTVAQSTQVQNTNATENKKKVTTGKTIGNPELSEKAQKYYEQLKKKYGNMDFILVSVDMKEQAKAHAADYANANRMVVLIDTEKIERMATDEKYRKQYEGIISGATAKLAQVQTSLGSVSANIKTYGMQVNDGGTASFFAVIDKSLASQKKRIEKNKEKKNQEKAAAEKKAEKNLTDKNLIDKKQAEERRQHSTEKTDATKEYMNTKETDASEDSGNYVTITASTIEELVQKIQDTLYSNMSDSVQTEEEKMLGQHIDFRG